MFSVILPSRPCLTDVVPMPSDPTVPANNFAFTFPALPKFSHIVIFLLPGVILPADTAAAVYIQFPKDLILNSNNGTTNPQLSTPAVNTPPDFKFLGAIANEKPSAIFKVSFPSGRRRTEAEEEDEMMDEGAASVAPVDASEINPNATITLGITIEPMQAVASKMADLQAQLQRSSVPSTTDLTKLSAGQPAAAVTTGTPSVPVKSLAQRIIGNAFNYLASFAVTDPRAPGEEIVPLRAFKDWWAKFESRIDSDPRFLERAAGV
ncbi:hypothetical protein AJ78_02767 [Emergomyces pasteurianus Ep9510]|uniref:Uncharacterized protein n=1 Tax=Emergomyces pasteurianus Ep9510 TaxID=1447872 RepID=A0A1J9PMM1_9EURO|nr:hypothetical protein AJ78_02767 [Emergomyces pasteurianus Ep9510]